MASHKAAVTVAIVGLGARRGLAKIYDAQGSVREVDNVCPYLVPYQDIYIEAATHPLSALHEMVNGNKPADGGNLLMGFDESEQLRFGNHRASAFVRRFVGAEDSIQGKLRFCLWIKGDSAAEAEAIPAIEARIAGVRRMRLESAKQLTKRGASSAHAFQQIRQRGDEAVILIPRHSSESRPYLPVSLWPPGTIVADGAFALHDADIWNLSLLCCRLHLVWIAAVCRKIKTDYRYSSTLGWNTFPVPFLSEKNKTDLTFCADEILLAREAHFPATIADLYNPEDMHADLRAAHERNDEVLERIYIGRRFKNDTERLEKLFDLYTKMKAGQGTSKKNKPEATA